MLSFFAVLRLFLLNLFLHQIRASVQDVFYFLALCLRGRDFFVYLVSEDYLSVFAQVFHFLEPPSLPLYHFLALRSYFTYLFLVFPGERLVVLRVSLARKVQSVAQRPYICVGLLQYLPRGTLCFGIQLLFVIFYALLKLFKCPLFAFYIAQLCIALQIRQLHGDIRKFFLGGKLVILEGEVNFVETVLKYCALS